MSIFPKTNIFLCDHFKSIEILFFYLFFIFIFSNTTNVYVYFAKFSFASRAKSIKNKPKLNEVMSDAALLKRYKKQIDMLTRELQVIMF